MLVYNELYKNFDHNQQAKVSQFGDSAPLFGVVCEICQDIKHISILVSRDLMNMVQYAKIAQYLINRFVIINSIPHRAKP